jgi:ATP-dependent protease ClpP protease subunit
MRAASRRPDLVKKWCDEETYFTAEEAVANGFADEIIERKRK